VKIPPLKLISEALECDQKSLNNNSGLNNHSSWDSMGHLSVMMALEKEYGINIDEDTINKFQKMENIIEFYNTNIKK
tara:strand:+ start:1021 stop:1251 length:231 start_codon:yes stop_codon:yes gene_type:complete